MEPVRKTFEIQIQEMRKDGGRILINTAGLDRDRDRVMPSGAVIENYSRNPVVQWAHNYREPWATVGKTLALDQTPDGIVADFELRPAANDQDPQNIVRLLWEGGWVRTASIGFIPKVGKPNADGGTDFSEWELLEWSLVPIPSNQQALRLAVKALDEPEPEGESKETSVWRWQWGAPAQIEAELKRGRVLSAKNEGKIRAARDRLNEVLAEVEDQPERDEGESDEKAEPVKSKGAIPPHETPKADPDAEWDGPGVVASLPNEAAALRRAHAWVDEDGDPDAKQSYKFPHHLPDGRVVLRGVNNARARLSGANIPEEDRAGVDRHLVRHQEQFERSVALRGYARALVELADELELGLHNVDAGGERDLADSLNILLNTLKEAFQ